MRTRSILAAGFAAAVAASRLRAAAAPPPAPGRRHRRRRLVAPADTAAFVAVDTDLGSGQWRRSTPSSRSLPGTTRC